MCTTYEGWENVFTAHFNLEFENDPLLHEDMLQIISRSERLHEFAFPEMSLVESTSHDLQAIYGEANALLRSFGRTEFDDILPRHLLQIALDTINWQEIAAHWITKVQELRAHELAQEES